jgi:hypothetical protein
VKDVISPAGAVSLRAPTQVSSSDLEGHTAADELVVAPTHEPESVRTFPDSPGHQDLCNRQAAFVARAIKENIDLTDHIQDVIRSLEICLAADKSIRTGLTIKL